MIYLLTGDEELIDKALCRIRDERSRGLAFLLRFRGMARTGRNFPWAKKIHCGDTSEVWDDGVQVHVDSHLKLLNDATSDRVDSTVYRQMITSLMYLTNTRPNICFAVNTLSQFMVDPRRVHWIAAKHVLRYLKRTVEYGLRYSSDHEINL